MPLNKKQIARLIKFTGMMKRGKYPNAKTFVKILNQSEWSENEPYLACSEKTIHRDIETLKKDYHAPIKFDRARNGYYLTVNSWELNFPVLRDETMLASLLGLRLAEDLVPDPVKSDISYAVDQQLTSNAHDILDTGYIDSLIAASGVKVTIDPVVFKTVFDAWQDNASLAIKYRSQNGNISQRRIEPHILTYYNSAWYIKGICLEKNEVRVFAIHRIIEAEKEDRHYEPDLELIEEAKKGNIFNYKENTVTDIQVLCSAEIAGYVKEQYSFYNETIKEHQDGSVTVFIPQAPSHTIIKWVLSEGGNAKILEPSFLADEVVAAAEKVLEANKQK